MGRICTFTHFLIALSQILYKSLVSLKILRYTQYGLFLFNNIHQKKFQVYILSNVPKVMRCQLHTNRRYLWTFLISRKILIF